MSAVESALGGWPVLQRPRLVSRVDRVLSTRLTLVVAPAGFGKSVLLDQWAHALAGRADVVRLDFGVEHNDPQHFRSALLEAAAPVLGPLADGGGPVDPTDLTGFVDAVKAREASAPPLVFLLDGVERVVDSVLFDVLSAALRLLPPATHIVIASRTAPNLLLGERRATGDLVELSAADLAVSTAEGEALLERVPALSRESLDAAAGWFVGLALLARSNGESTDAVGEYIDDVVLAGLPPHDLAVLEATAGLDELDRAGVAHVLDSAEGIGVVRRLAEAGRVPLVRTGDESWRLVPVLRQHLAERMVRRDPQRAASVAGLVAELSARRSPLSARETEILLLLDSDRTVARIADELGVSYHTAKTHVRSIYDKLEASTRVLALQRARQLGILSSTGLPGGSSASLVSSQ